MITYRFLILSQEIDVSILLREDVMPGLSVVVLFEKPLSIVYPHVAFDTAL